MKDYHKILGVKKTATQAQIKRAYRKLALKWHPDKNKSPNAREVFIEITEAYKILTDKDSRSRYRRTKTKEKTQATKTKEKTAYSSGRKAYQQWSDLMENRANREAQREAEMNYKEFKKQAIKGEQYIEATLALIIIGAALLTASIYWTAQIQSLKDDVTRAVHPTEKAIANEELDDGLTVRNFYLILFIAILFIILYRYQKQRKAGKS